VLAANFGAGTLFLNGSNASSNWAQATELNAFTGTAVNASNELSPVTTSPASLAFANNSANGKAAVFAVSTAGFTNIAITLAAQRTASGFTNQLWEFSPDGTSWTAIGNLASGSAAGTIASAFNTSGVLGFSNISGLANLPNALVRVTLTGATNSSGNNRVDNIQILGEPFATGPTITATPATVPALIATQGAPSAGSSFTAAGANLTGNITVAAADAVNFAISTNASIGYINIVAFRNGRSAIAAAA
jgi:hypothetical protein